MTHRPGYTLLELMVALGSASVLMVGLSSALFIAAQGLDLDQGASASRGRADAVMGRLLADARTATRFRSVTPTAIEFDVPDRTGDGASDRLRYEWSGVAGSPLTRSLNGGAAATLLSDVRALTFGSTTRAVTAQDFSALSTTDSPIVWGQAAPSTATGVKSLSLAMPPKVVPGDLLIALLATTQEQESVTSAGWTELCYATNGNNNKIRLSAWQRPAMGSEPAAYTWNWPNTAHAVGGIVVVSNHDPSGAVAPTGRAIVGDVSGSSAACPIASIIKGNSIVFRLVASSATSIASDPADITRIWAQGVTNLTAGWGYSAPVSTPTTSAASFALSSNAPYTAITIVITPRTPVGP